MRSLVLAAVGTIIVIGLAVIAVQGILSYWDVTFLPESWWPESWAPPNSWSEWRDIVIVMAGVFMAMALFLIVIILAVMVFLLITIRRLIRDNVGPAVDSLKESIDNVRGTAEFMGEAAAAPVIRVYSVVNGVRTGLGAVRNLPDRVRDRRRKK
jgi:hypothetical protein